MNITLPAGNRLAIEYRKELALDLGGLKMAWQFSF